MRHDELLHVNYKFTNKKPKFDTKHVTKESVKKLLNKPVKVGREHRGHYQVFTGRDCGSVPLNNLRRKARKVDDFQEPLTLTPPDHTK